MYRRYSLEEVKHKIIDILQIDNTGLSGVELALKTGINRMTITKYLNVLSTLGLIRKKKIGSVNVWLLESGVADFEYPINYLEVQQRFMGAILGGDAKQAHRIITSMNSSNIEKLKILTDVIVPTANTLNELYNRGRLEKTERISLMNTIVELVDVLKYNLSTEKMKPNAYALFIVGSENNISYAKIAAIAFQMAGWTSTYIGNVEQYIDPFFDIDIQRYIAKIWSSKKGLMIICICSSEESSLRFLSTAAISIKSKLKGKVNVVLFTGKDLHFTLDNLEADYVADDLQSLVEFAEQEYNRFK
jgi:predicted transcriptional regulator